MDTFGTRLKAARKAAKLTQAVAAKKAGMSQPALSELESGQYPSSTFTAQLAHTYGVSARWLAEGRGAPEAGVSQSDQDRSATQQWPFKGITAEQVGSLAPSQLAQLEQAMALIMRGFSATSQAPAQGKETPAIAMTWQERDDPLLQFDTAVEAERNAGSGGRKKRHSTG